jgi:hypothetical protein
MSTANEYRNNAEDCLRMASKASEERDRPLWATMAQSWLRLAEHADTWRQESVVSNQNPESMDS